MVEVNVMIRSGGLSLLPLACFGGLMAVFAVALFKGHLTMLIIASLVYLCIGILLATLNKEEMRQFWGTLIATGTLFPATLVLITAAIYIIGWTDPMPYEPDGKYALFWGSAITGWAWFAAAFIFRPFADARNALHSSYGEFDKRFCQVTSALQVLCSEVSGDLNSPTQCTVLACKEIQCLQEQIKQELSIPGYPWVLATGYINIWDRLYRAEEALIQIVPQEKVVEGALYDELRLEGSYIDTKQREELLSKLRQAVSVMDPGAKQFLKSSGTVTAPLAIITASQLPIGSVGRDYCWLLQATGGVAPYKWQVTEDSKKKQLEDCGLKLDETTGVLSGKVKKELQDFSFSARITDNTGLMLDKHFTLSIKDSAVVIPHSVNVSLNTEARAVLRTVRSALNEYRGGRWNGLILARNRLMATTFLTSLMVYILLAAALITHVQKDAILTASIFYVVGATIGLGDRLNSESENKTGVYDYGLSAAGLITIPIFSGFTAISGVVLIAMLPYAGQILGPLRTEPLAISSPAQLREGAVSKAYIEQLAATGGTTPYKWTIAMDGRGAIPDGLVLSYEGLLSGTPTNSGEGRFFVQVTDDTGAMVEKMFTLTIKPQPTPLSDRAINSPEPAPRTIAAPGSSPAESIPLLNDIFNLRKNLGGLLIAAIFGLTPRLFFSKLNQLTNKYTADLKSSQPSQARQT